MSKNEPYIKTTETKVIYKYNPEYGDSRICECGHPYYRHFDTYEYMYPCGCKYCGCFRFKEEKEGTINWIASKKVENGNN